MASTIQVDTIKDIGGNTMISSNGSGTFTSNLPGTTLSGSTNNTVTTVSAANAIRGRDNFIYNGTIVGCGDSGASADLGVGLHIKTADSGASVNSDADQLVIEGSTGSIGMSILSATNGTGDIYFGDSGNNAAGFIQYNHSSNYMRFGTNAATERMRLDSTGDIYVGKTTGGQSVAGIKLEGSSGTVLATRNQAVAGIFTRLNNDGEVVRIMSNTSTVGTISISGSSTAYNTSSDYRLKENEAAISDGITRLKTLKPYRFNFKADNDEDGNVTRTVDGFFAHEVTAVPEAIYGEKDGEEMQGIDQSKLVPLLVASLQEAITKIETLETENTDIKARLTALENA